MWSSCPRRRRARVADQAERLGPATTVRALEVLGAALVEMRHATDPRVLLDVALVRLANPAADDSPAALLERIERLERSGAPPMAALDVSCIAAGVVERGSRRARQPHPQGRGAR